MLQNTPDEIRDGPIIPRFKVAIDPSDSNGIEMIIVLIQQILHYDGDQYSFSLNRKSPGREHHSIFARKPRFEFTDLQKPASLYSRVARSKHHSAWCDIACQTYSEIQ